MDRECLFARLGVEAERSRLVNEARTDPVLVEELFATVRTERSALRYSASKILRILGEESPACIYPYYGEVTDWLRDVNSFVKWDGILTLANLAVVDTQERFVPFYEEYFGLIRDPQMITAANVVRGAWKFLRGQPAWEPDITRRLLEVPKIVYLHHGEPSPECNRVMCGRVLDCFDHYYDFSQNQTVLLCFARSLLECPRKSVAKNAARFLRRHSQ